MAEFKFTQNILGSNNGIEIKEYLKGDIITEKDLAQDLFNAWSKRKVIIPVDAEENADGDANGDAIPQANTGDEQVDAFLNGETDKIPDGTEEIDENEALILEIRNILAEEQLTEEQVIRLKEIGVALKIQGMAQVKNPKVILEKIEQFIDDLDAEKTEENADGDANGDAQ